jgi:hypothetical protein
MQMHIGKKGQGGAMGIVTLAVTIMIGLVVVGYVYNSLDLTSIPDSAESAINDTLDNTTTGMTGNRLELAYTHETVGCGYHSRCSGFHPENHRRLEG